MRAKPLHIVFLERLLRAMAIVILKRHRPTIVCVTGSVGKSSTKEAILSVLNPRFRVRANTGNLNNEIGIPLVILGSKGGGSSLLQWMAVPFRFLLTALTLRSRYPDILVLELGIDRIGDMDYFLEFLRPNVGILTSISSSHLEFFKTIAVVGREKGKLIRSIPGDGLAVLNADEPRVLKFRGKIKAPILSYGFGKHAEVRATNVSFFRDSASTPIGTSFKLEYDGKSIPVRLPNVIAEHHIHAALAASAVGIFFKMNLLEIAEALQNFQSLPGRMRLFEGVRRSLLIDDTYNASPKSLEAALQTLGNLGGIRRLVALGDMLELGTDSDMAHDTVAAWIVDYDIHEVFLLGPRMLRASRELLRKGFPSDRIHIFSDPETLGEQLAASLREGDIVLLKGSQAMRLEKAVEMVMADPSSSEELLCRQSAEWKRKPFVPESAPGISM